MNLEGRGAVRACLDATRIVATLHFLAVLHRELGRMPTQFEYAERMQITDRQARRHYAEIRAAYPRDDGAPESVVQCAERVTRHVVLAMRAADDAPSALSQPALSF
jgi:hypothetical protein